MKITMLLSGQGEIPSAETVAMWRTDADAVAVWDEAEDAVGPIRQWLDEGVPSDTLRAQLISAVGSLATYAVVRRELGLVPRFVIGHSVGGLLGALLVFAILLALSGVMYVDSRRSHVDHKNVNDDWVEDVTDRQLPVRTH